MNITIGKKIRELRKDLKMTQSELAGSEMTKSMLSHIETGHSNPSMRNLEYIARKLNKPMAYFLEEDTDNFSDQNEENQLPIEKILQKLKTIDEFIKEKSYKLAKKESNVLLDLYAFNEKSKLYADIVYRIGYCDLKLKRYEEGAEFLELCCSIYTNKMFYVEAVRAYLDLLRVNLEIYNYSSCFKLLDKIYEVYSKSSSKDIFIELEILILQPAIHFAQGDFQKTIDVCEMAISLSKKNNIYYRLDDAYRILAITYMLQGDFKNFNINANEAKKYVEFTGNKLNLVKIYHNYAKYENAKGNPLEAFKYLDLLEANSSEKTFYYYLEHGKAQYLLGNYTEALRDLMKITYMEKPCYQVDCIYMATSKLYKGLIYSKLEDFKKAVLELEEGITDIEAYTNIEYKGFIMYAYNELTFAYSSLSEVYSLKGDYKMAYALLKKSNEASVICKNQ